MQYLISFFIGTSFRFDQIVTEAETARVKAQRWAARSSAHTASVFEWPVDDRLILWVTY